MHVLWIATKPPWPPVDGGRLATWNTLGGLLAEGHRITLVAPLLGGDRRAIEAGLGELTSGEPPAGGGHPEGQLEVELVPARLSPRPIDALGALLTGRPFSIHRHGLPAMRRRVVEVLARETIDVAHVEQVQAWPAVEGLADRPPVILRAQNVESELFRMMADPKGWMRPWLHREARRLAAYEGRVVAELASGAGAAVALTPEDARHLASLAERAEGADPESIRSRSSRSAWHRDSIESARHRDATEGARHRGASESARHRGASGSASESARHRDAPEGARHRDAPEGARHRGASEGARHREPPTNSGGRGGVEVHVLPAPFDPELPAGAPRLEGDPPLVVFGSAGWLPNRAGALWFLRSIWPEIHRRQPQARLHLFGMEDLLAVDRVFGLGESAAKRSPSSVRTHPAPASSVEALAEGSVLVVPLHVASGVRMKILEAWARGIPVIATPTAARGLGAETGRHLHVADDAEAFATAIAELRDPPRRRAMVEAARDRLATEHDPRRVARQLVEIYERARKKARNP